MITLLRAAEIVLVCLLAMPAAGPAPAFAQDQGVVDNRADVSRRIKELEAMVGGDEPAEQQAVSLLWLADLYVAAGRMDDARRAYEQILVFFPFDPAATNAYATFLMEKTNDPAHADSILADAIANAEALPSLPSHIGRTYALRARALRALGRCAEALPPSDRAIALLDEDAAEEALRVKAACLAETGRRDEATAAYSRLIGENGGSNPDDVSNYIALLTATNGSVSAEVVRSTINRAIETARDNRREWAMLEGAQIVVLTAKDGARLEATLLQGDSARAVLFVPESGGRRTSFRPYAQLLSLDDATVLMLDPRGHGDSRCDSLPDAALLSEENRAKIADDIAVGILYLRDELEFPPASIVVVSEGDGSGFVERARHENGLAVATVHLSPVFDPADRALATALSFRPPAPALLLASREDLYAVRSLGYFMEVTDGENAATRIFSAAGHGVSLLRDPARYLVMSEWLDAVFAPGH